MGIQLPLTGAQHHPRFSAHVYCGQTAGWMKMPFSKEVVVGPGHIVLDGDPAHPLQRGTVTPNFRPMSVVAKGLDGSRCHLVWWYASAPCLLWPQSPISATAELLLFKLECGSMPNVIVALPNIGGALCSTQQSLADALYLTAVQ